MLKELIHATLIVFSIFISFLITKITANEFDLQLTAFLFTIFFIFKKISLIKDKEHLLILNSIIFTLIITNIVNSTGGLNSQFFFLYYFLIFALSLILEPTVSAITSISLVIFYLFVAESKTPIQSFFPIISLPFLTPFALFLGKEYRKIEDQKKIINNLNYKNDFLQEEIKSDKQQNFLFLSLIIKNNITNIKKHVDNFMGDNDLQKIKKITEKTEQLIEDYEKNL